MRSGIREDKVNTTMSPSSSSSPPLHLFYSQDKLAVELNYFSESVRRRSGGEEKERKRLPLPQDNTTVAPPSLKLRRFRVVDLERNGRR